MEMEKINEKLEAFASMVLKDAAHKAGLLINQAKTEKQKLMEDKEISYLKEAYQKIQEALLRIDKECNEIYSSKLFETKQLLFKKRQDIVTRIFKKVEDRLESFRRTPEYVEKLRGFIEDGLTQVGSGEIHVLVDPSDRVLAEEIKKKIGRDLTIEESDEPLEGGCIILNSSCGLLVDHSFHSRIVRQRDAFLEHSGLNIDI